jgi:probable rRNA maturation factor
MYDIEVQVEAEAPAGAAAAVEAASRAALAHLAIKQGALTVLLTGDDRLRQLNRDFRSEDTSTDVLSFPGGDLPPGLAREESPYLGDIAISLNTAQHQAEAAGHTWLEEIQLLTVHGVLHLLGLDHLEEEEKREMWGIQDSILSRMGIGRVNPTEQ